MQHLVYELVRTIACTSRKNGLSKFVIAIDFQYYRLRYAPPMSTSRMSLNIFQNHYPERVFRFYICNPPTVFFILFNLIKPFIDPVTSEKIKFSYG